MTDLKLSRKERHAKKTTFRKGLHVLQKFDFVGVVLNILFAITIIALLWQLLSF